MSVGHTPHGDGARKPAATADRRQRLRLLRVTVPAATRPTDETPSLRTHSPTELQSTTSPGPWRQGWRDDSKGDEKSEDYESFPLKDAFFIGYSQVGGTPHPPPAPGERHPEPARALCSWGRRGPLKGGLAITRSSQPQKKPGHLSNTQPGSTVGGLGSCGGCDKVYTSPNRSRDSQGPR